MKQDLVMEPSISKQKDSGKMDSDAISPEPERLIEPPVWRREPKQLSKKETLRRQYKTMFGYKPCDKSIKEMEREIDAVTLRQTGTNIAATEKAETPTIGDAIQAKKINHG